MIMDRTLLFSDGQAITATAASTNTVDLGATGTVYGASSPIVRDVGPGLGVPLHCGVTQSFNNLTSLTISIETDDNAAFSSAVTVFTSPAYTLAQLAAGAKQLLPTHIPVGTNERYMRLKYTVAGTAPTLGKITAGVVDGRQSA
ncbi:MAG: hypothetical protein J7500_15760 [Sphingomonas sp.]|uniref:Bbp16 family capsid cement protein n=1 Tax=Sphingomonas sp. TaxID=28214 RepID=UPI001B00779A|nr:hypothetical protein [Sphingomonas sp.]MBO9624164.1 hypothetical protein [Sphingomonas sp.]